MPSRFPLFVMLLLFSAPAPAMAAPSVNEQYASCTKTIASDPEGTFKRARAWYGQSKTLASQHCMALALYEMKDYEGAANALETMLQGMTPSQGQLWMNMKLQTAKAHYASGNHTAADKHLSDALHWASNKEKDDDMVPLLLQRAKMYDLHNENLKAVQDLDHAMSIRPSTQIRMLRAQLLAKMGKKSEAILDVDAILKEEPKNKEAAALRNYLQ
jgi:tetratricopeptide (TPR) repeat protein